MILAGLMGALSAAGATPTVAWSGISYTSVDEGVQNTVSLNLTNWDGSQIYWFLTDGSSQLSSGQVTAASDVLSPGTGNSSQSFNFTFNNDVTTDGPLYYYVRIENEAGDLLIPQQGVFTCNDTSQDNAGLMFRLDTANDVTGGVWVDSSGKSRNASMYFLDAYSADNGGVYVFNGSSTFATVPSLQNSAYTSISLSAWVKPSANSSDTIVAKELCYKLRINADATVQWYVGPGSGWDVNLQTSAGVITAGTWYHIVATVDATAAKIYINGNMVATTSGTTIGVNNQPLVIGAYTYNTTTDDFFGGRMGEVKMWNYALNAPNIETEFTTTNSRYNPPSYTWGSYDTTVDEGGTLTVNVNTGNVADGTTLYWNVVLGSTLSTGDFTVTSGQFSITDNTGAFNIELTSDTLTEGNETFTVSILTGSTVGTVVLTSNSITIGDTSAGNRAPIAYLFNGSGSYTELSNNVYSDISNLAYQDSDFIDIAKGSYPTPQAGWSYRPGSYAGWNTIASVSDNGSYWNIELSPGGTGGANDSGQLTDNINADWALGTTWTIEFWVKPTVVPGRNGAPDTPQRILSQNTDLNVQNNYGYNNLDICFTQGIIAIANQYAGFDAPAEMVGVWSHVAISSDSGLVSCFINGVKVYEAGWAINFTNGVADLYIGKNGTRASPNVNAFDGLLTDIRISNTARYTSAFNPATALAPTTDGNTKLLLTPKQDSWYGSAARKLGYNNVITVDYPTPPIYTVDYVGPNNVDEGSGKAFAVSGTNIPNGTYYWTVTNSSDFATTDGSFSITDNSGSFSVTPTADETTEGAETFTVQIRSGSITGVILATSSTVTINDTSLTKVQLTSGTALVFNGTNNYHMVVEDSLTDWNLGDNWTIEWWQKIPVGVSGFLSVLCQDANVPTYSGIDVFVNAGNICMFNGNLTVSEAPATRGEWNHIAIQKNGTTLAAYINGVSRTVGGSHSGTIAPSSPLNVVIGSRTADGGANFYGQYFNGRLANIRISTIARYSGTFTVPTTVISDANTVLALSGQVGGSGMYDDVSPSNHTITNNGVIANTVMDSIGPMNSAYSGGGPGTVYFDRSVYPGVESVPIGATMSSAIFASPVTITNSQVWTNSAYWYVDYVAPPGTPDTTTSQTFTITWIA